MKRSQVLSSIQQQITVGLTLDESISEIANFILSDLEDLGMLPPSCSVTIKDGKHTPTERKWDEEK